MTTTKSLIAKIFLYPTALLPLLGLFWDAEIGLLKANWILYPVVFLNLGALLWMRNKTPMSFALFALVSLLYIIKSLISGTSPEPTFRFCVSLVPLFFIDSIWVTPTTVKKRAMIVYILCISFPIVYGILQYIGVVPFMEYDFVDGEVIGRMSGGYSKPNNFTAFIFPLYLFSFFLFRKRKLWGGALLILILSLIYLTGYRTTTVIYLVVLIGFFFQKSIRLLIMYYYKYFLHVLMGLIFMIGVYTTNKYYGQIEIRLIRGRFPTWEGHVTNFLNQSLPKIMFGQGHTDLPERYNHKWYEGSLVEPHNNTFRVLIVFGLFGYLLYSLLMRWFVLRVLSSGTPSTLFYLNSSILFVTLYGITNEPAFYPAIFWVVFLGIFLNGNAAPTTSEEK